MKPGSSSESGTREMQKTHTAAVPMKIVPNVEKILLRTLLSFTIDLKEMQNRRTQ